MPSRPVSLAEKIARMWSTAACWGLAPFRYARWCVEMARAARNPLTAPFFLRELHSCVTDGRRADGLTIEGARACLSGDEDLLRQFDRMSERAVVPEPSHDSRESQESTDGVKEERRGGARQ